MRIIVGAYSRSSLGHLIRSCRVAAFLKERGHDVTFCCAEETADVARAHGVNVAVVPELPALGPWHNIKTEDDIRQSTRKRMASPDFLRKCIAVEAPLIETFRPDAIVSDLRNTLAVLGASHDIPVVNLTNMKLLMFPMPIVYPCIIEGLQELGIPEKAARKVLGDVIVIPGFSSYEPLVDVAPPIWSMIRETVREIRYVGPILPRAAEPVTETPSGRAASVYFTLGGATSASVDLVAVLRKLTARTERFVVHHGEHLAESAIRDVLAPRAGGELECFAYRADSYSVMTSANVAVIHGGHGTVYEAMAGGVPSLVIPSNAEQASNGRLLGRLGMGMVLEPSASEAELNQALDRLLSDSSVKQRAADVSRRVRAESGLENIARLLESGVL